LFLQDGAVSTDYEHKTYFRLKISR
jgi:hypothetical protein